MFDKATINPRLYGFGFFLTNVYTTVIKESSEPHLFNCMIRSRINALLSDVIVHEHPHLTFALHTRWEKHLAWVWEQGFLSHCGVIGASAVEQSSAVVLCRADVDVVYLQCLWFVRKAAEPIATFYVDRLG